jgi:long-chain acyl-CoA synthetase
MTLDLSRVECLGDALRDALSTYKTRVALLEADRQRENARFSYQELQREAERLTARLQEAGVEPGDRCAILMSNQARWVMSSFGVLWSGAVLVPLDYKLTAKEQLALLAHAKPKVLITEYGIYRSLAREDSAQLASLLVMVTEARPDDAIGQAARWETPARGPFRYVGRRRSDTASIVYSSGTGGTPKGCMLSHENYLEQAQVLGRMYPMEPDDVYFSVLPTNHAIDFMCGTILPFLFGAAVAHQRTLRPEFLAHTMKRYRVTHTAMVQRILKTLRERIEEQLSALPEWQRTAVHALTQVNDVATLRTPRPWLSRTLLKPIHDRFGGRLRLIFAGGGFVDPELASYFYRLGLPVVIGYGLTEACTVLTLNDLHPFRPDTVGRAIDGVELELRDANRDGVGEVRVRSRTLMQGYFDAPELTAEALVDGWLHTGDLGTIDASGHLKLQGRLKNMIVTEGGKNIYPEDIEAAFDKLPCEELCVFAVPYVWQTLELRGESLCLVLRLKAGVSLSDALIAIRAANLKLAEYKRVSSYAVVQAEFPRTASMKVKRAELAAVVRAGVHAPTALSKAQEALRNDFSPS